MQEKEYLEVIVQSLKKKRDILWQLQKKNEEQQILLQDENLAPGDFDNNIEEKASLIEKLELLDQGFEEVYERVRSVLKGNQDDYKPQIQTMQGLIRDITAASNDIQAKERRNYQLAKRKFESIKKQVREVKASYKAVNHYYRNMMKMNYVDAQFMDDKK